MLDLHSFHPFENLKDLVDGILGDNAVCVKHLLTDEGLTLSRVCVEVLLLQNTLKMLDGGFSMSQLGVFAAADHAVSSAWKRVRRLAPAEVSLMMFLSG